MEGILALSQTERQEVQARMLSGGLLWRWEVRIRMVSVYWRREGRGVGGAVGAVGAAGRGCWAGE